MSTGSSLAQLCAILFAAEAHLDLFPANISFFPNGKLSDAGLFEAETAILGTTGKNPGMDFFLI